MEIYRNLMEDYGKIWKNSKFWPNQSLNMARDRNLQVQEAE